MRCNTASASRPSTRNLAKEVRSKRPTPSRATESLGLLYADHFPHRQFATARGVRHSPLHERLAARGACFGEAAGWERASWFLPQDASARGEQPEYRYSWGRQNWFEQAAAEHTAVREGGGRSDIPPERTSRDEGKRM